MEAKKGKANKRKTTENEGEDKIYMRWNLEMERVLADVLRDQRNLGNKGDSGWKSTAFNIASSLLSAQFSISINSNNIKNRVKIWKKIYGIVSDILSQSGFNWDDTKKMITIDDENVWNEYVKSHEDAKQFRWKVITNWDDIVDLCGKDRATGEGAETAVDADDGMSLDEETNETDWVNGTRGQSSSTSAVPPPKKRGGSKDALASAVARMASALEEFMQSSIRKVDAGEVYDEVYAVLDLDDE